VCKIVICFKMHPVNKEEGTESHSTAPPLESAAVCLPGCVIRQMVIKAMMLLLLLLMFVVIAAAARFSSITERRRRIICFTAISTT